MRISDWSSDVCSSDLRSPFGYWGRSARNACRSATTRGTPAPTLRLRWERTSERGSDAGRSRATPAPGRRCVVQGCSWPSLLKRGTVFEPALVARVIRGGRRAPWRRPPVRREVSEIGSTWSRESVGKYGETWGVAETLKKKK